MATITPAVTKLGGDEDVVKIVWGPATLVADAFVPAEWVNHADRSVQVLGTFDSGTIVFEGTNDGTNYYTLNDATGSPLSFTTAGLKEVLELTALVRPRITVANASTSLTVSMVARRPQEMRT